MKLYVGTYKKYNEGSLFGKWLDLDDYKDKDEFLRACYELHEEYWEIKSELTRLHVDEDVFDAWLTNQSENPTADDVKTCQEQYIGKYESEADFAEQWYIDTGDPITKSHLAQYIDWDDVYRAEFSFDGFWNDNNYFFDSRR